jgi:ribonuclease HI
MKSKRRKRHDKATMVMNLFPSVEGPVRPCVIHFDGGTSNNVPSRGGYGIGYGSYLLDDGEVVSLNFRRPMSNNEGEVRTLIAAVEAAKLTREPEKTRLCLYGDSRLP